MMNVIFMPAFMVACGGAIGALLRYYAGQSVHIILSTDFPYGTFFVNVFGSFLLGVLAAYFVTRAHDEPLRLFLATGMLGAFTTFSTFSFDAMNLWMRGEAYSAALYVIGSVILSLMAVFAGFILMQKVFS